MKNLMIKVIFTLLVAAIIFMVFGGFLPDISQDIPADAFKI